MYNSNEYLRQNLELLREQLKESELLFKSTYEKLRIEEAKNDILVEK